MKNLKKRVLGTIVLGLIGVFIFQSCNSGNEVSISENLSLVSPHGKTLANSKTDLVKILINNSNDVSISDEIKIKNIRYNENDKFSVGIVNFDVNSENKSLLVPLELDDNIIILVDDENVYFEEVTLKSTSFEEKNIITSNKIKTSKTSAIASRVAYVCNGGCCEWSNPGPGHYNCGCGATSLILTTSDGCGIEVIQ